MYQRILVPYDGSLTSVAGLDEAIKLAKLTKASVRLVHVIDELSYVTGFEAVAVYASDVIPAMKRAGEELLVKGRSRAASNDVPVDSILLQTSGLRLSDCVIGEALRWQADLIVIGTHGRRGAARLLMGSDAEQIVRCSPLPVLLVRAPAAASAAAEVNSTPS